MENRILSIITLFLITSFFVEAKDLVDKDVAKKIAKEKGILEPPEVLKWQTLSKDIPKDWIKVDNKYFSVSYPKCFNIQGQESEDDIKISPSLLFERGANCNSSFKLKEDPNWFTLSYFPRAGIKSLHWSLGSKLQLLRQKGIINGIDGIILGAVKDRYVSEQINEVLFRWEIFIICNKKPFRMVTETPQGKPTMDFLEKGKYNFPEDFKEIISTFQCK